MALIDQAIRAVPYLQRLVFDREAQDAVRRTVGASRDTYARARGKSARQVATDKKLRRRLQQTVGAGREVWTALGQPARRKRRWRLRLSALALGGAGALVAANPQAREKVLTLVNKKDAKTADPLHESSKGG
jgi:hypothetical protein